MSNDSRFQSTGDHYPDARHAKKSNTILWVMGGLTVVLTLFCGAGLAGLVYFGSVTPETSIYVGSRVPNRYVKMAEETGAIEKGESIKFFYSDALLDARESFVLATESKLSIHIDDGREKPLEIIEFSNIESIEMVRGESFFTDSQITLELKDGDYVSILVSSEYDRDVIFLEHIEKHIQ